VWARSCQHSMPNVAHQRAYAAIQKIAAEMQEAGPNLQKQEQRQQRRDGQTLAAEGLCAADKQRQVLLGTHEGSNCGSPTCAKTLASPPSSAISSADACSSLHTNAGSGAHVGAMCAGQSRTRCAVHAQQLPMLDSQRERAGVSGPACRQAAVGCMLHDAEGGMGKGQRPTWQLRRSIADCASCREGSS
jgi:hypothetical protein